MILFLFCLWKSNAVRSTTPSSCKMILLLTPRWHNSAQWSKEVHRSFWMQLQISQLDMNTCHAYCWELGCRETLLDMNIRTKKSTAIKVFIYHFPHRSNSFPAKAIECVPWRWVGGCYNVLCNVRYIGCSWKTLSGTKGITGITRLELHAHCFSWYVGSKSCMLTRFIIRTWTLD